MAWDRTKAVAYLRSNSNKGDKGLPKSLGRCAEYVRKAIEAGGVTLTRHGSAKDYGSSLVACGFICLNAYQGYFFAGDVAIIQPIPGHPHGHMTMFDGRIWISDFEQWRGFYPGESYRKNKPAYAMYRYPTVLVAPPQIFRATSYA